VETAAKIFNCESLFVMCGSMRSGNRLWWCCSGLLEDRGVGFLLAVGVDWTGCEEQVAGHDMDCSDSVWRVAL
jgi:hypothetical protein